MLRATNLRKEYASIVAVDGVSFEVARGEIFALLGPNGAGKTTCIRIVLNILQPDAGNVLYDGKPFSEVIRNRVGYLPEERGLYRKSRLLDTILYLARLRGMQSGAAHARAYHWLQRLDLLEHKYRRIEELSKGNQQKVQFICSILHDPDLVILDEPFSGFDPVNQMLFKDILMELKQRGAAVVFSTHQMDQAEKLSDSLCLVNKGRVMLRGSVREVKKNYGANTVHLEFDGDGSFLQHLAGVKRALLYEHSAELELGQEATAQSLLPALIERIQIRKFEVLEPSLQSIFIQVVGSPENRTNSAVAAQ